MNKIIEWKYLYLKNDGFSRLLGTRERNDIIYVKYDNDIEVARIYINNVKQYVEVQYDNIMISEISKITWTKDSKNGSFIKSEKDDICLNTILRRYKKNLIRIVDLLDETIDKFDKQNMREQFINDHPNANTDNAE